MKPSRSGELNRKDWEQWAKNLLIFSAPALILFLTELSHGTDWKKAMSFLYLALINALIDLLKKYNAGK